MKFKVKNILLVSFLAIAGFFGVSSTLINKQVNEQPVVEKAEAWLNDQFYLKGTFNNWAELDSNYHMTYDGNTYGDYGNNLQYSGTFAFDSGVSFTMIGRWDGNNGWSEFKPNMMTDSSDTSPFYLDDTVHTRRAVKATLNIQVNGSWSGMYWTEVKSSITISADDTKGSASASSTSVSYKGSTTLTAAPESGYRFLGWKKSGTNTYESTSTSYTINNITSDLTYYACFDSSTTNTIYFDTAGYASYFTSAKLYYCDASGVEHSAWPGDAMSTVSHPTLYGSSTVYTATIPSDASLIIFVKGDKSNKTPDIEGGWSDGATYYLTSSTSGAWHSTYTITFNETGQSSYTRYAYSGMNVTMPSVAGSTVTGHTAEWNTASSGGGGSTYTIGESYPITSNLTLYRYNRPDTYTITFNPNGGTGSITTDSKTYGVPYTIPTPVEVGIGAGVGREALSWNTESNGSGTPYRIDGTDTYTGNSALTLHLIEDYRSYEYSVDNGSTWVQMPKMETTPDLCIAGYESDESNYLPGGAKIIFRSYYGSGTHTAQTINIWSGNQYEYDGNHYIEFGTNNKVVLTVQNDGNFKVNIYGGSERGIVVSRGGVDNKYVSDLSGNDYVCTLEVLPGDRIKAFHSWRTVYTVTMINYSSFGIDVNGNVSVPAVYTLTLKYNEGNYPSVEVTAMIATDTAKLIAQTFNTDMTTLCEGMEKGASPSSLTSQWSTESGYYSKLTTATKNILNGTTSSSDADILAMRAKYDRIVGKYKNSGASINDYMSRNPASLSSIRDFSPFTLFTNEEDNLSTIIIIAASSVALLSVTALSILVIKKRKNKEEQ